MPVFVPIEALSVCQSRRRLSCSSMSARSTTTRRKTLFLHDCAEQRRVDNPIRSTITLIGL